MCSRASRTRSGVEMKEKVMYRKYLKVSSQMTRNLDAKGTDQLYTSLSRPKSSKCTEYGVCHQVKPQGELHWSSLMMFISFPSIYGQSCWSSGAYGYHDVKFS